MGLPARIVENKGGSPGKCGTEMGGEGAGDGRGDLGLGWCRRSPPQFSVIHLLIPLLHGIGM